ncbi:NAD(P)-dependent oxidoreductase [Jatrophihabitans sp. DSM 45814]
MQQPDGADIAVIGLGVMGQAVATHLISVGRSVRGYDLSADALTRFAAAGGRVAASPAEAARGVGCALLIVHNESQVDMVIFGPGGLAETLAGGAVVWLASTVSPSYVRGLEPRLAQLGVWLVDGPVSGGPSRAGRGELSIFVGGEDEAIAAIRPLMNDCAAQLFTAGAIGAASTMKLINQILTASHIALTAEALALGQLAGIEPDLLITAITQSAGTSRQFELRAPRMAASDHRIDATIRTFEKDLTIAVDAANDLGGTVPMAEAARTVFRAADAFGFGDESDTMLLTAYERNLDETADPGPVAR